MIKKETIIEFQEALLEEYGKDTNFQEASIILNDLVSYFDLLARINRNTRNNSSSDIINEPD